MMAHTSNTPEVDPKEIENARAMWHSFTKLVRWGVIATAITLVLLLLLFY